MTTIVGLCGSHRHGSLNRTLTATAAGDTRQATRILAVILHPRDAKQVTVREKDKE
jgi:NAD(P)H-dependent FMN reductase